MKISKFPKISIITPSFNQGQFIEETIKSVLDQKYPNLEYIVMDGGSTDNTVEILKKYDDQISYWESAKDKGQSDAINRGFARATGDIIGWLNSDDMYMPNTFKTIASHFTNSEISNLKIVFGNCNHFQDGTSNYKGSDVKAAHEFFDLNLCDYIIQPSSFWTRETFKHVGGLNESQNFTFDWDWFIRAKNKGVEFVPIDDYLSFYRFHDDHKSGTGGDRRKEEITHIIGRVSEKLKKCHKKLRGRFEVRVFIKLANILEQTLEKFGRPVTIKKCNFIHRIVHYFYFRNISWFEFQNITRM